MAKDTLTISKSKCPDCGFEGNEQFPLGYAAENYLKLKKETRIDNGKKTEVEVPERNEIGKPLFVKRKRCPLCGYIEGRKLSRSE